MMSILKEMINLKKESNIFIITLQNRPVNALSKKLISELLILIDQISKSKQIQGLIISTGLDHFSAGADLKERSLMSNKETIDTVYMIKSLFFNIYNLPFPTLSIIKGACLGGGLELALSCDFRYSTKDAIFGLPETTLGIIPGGGGTQYLSRLIGLVNTKKLIYSGKKISSKEAAELGLVDKVVNKDTIYSKSLKLIKEFTVNSKTAIQSAKYSIDQGYNLDIKSALNIEFKEYIKTLDTKERVEALKKISKS